MSISTRIYLSDYEVEILKNLQKALLDFVLRVSGDDKTKKSQEEIAILPEIVKLLDNTL